MGRVAEGFSGKGMVHGVMQQGAWLARSAAQRQQAARGSSRSLLPTFLTVTSRCWPMRLQRREGRGRGSSAQGTGGAGSAGVACGTARCADRLSALPLVLPCCHVCRGGRARAPPPLQLVEEVKNKQARRREDTRQPGTQQGRTRGGRPPFNRQSPLRQSPLQTGPPAHAMPRRKSRRVHTRAAVGMQRQRQRTRRARWPAPLERG